MTQRLPKTFVNYIINHNSKNIDLFKITFGTKIYNLPDKVVSSRILMKSLNIKDNNELKIFQNVFFDYFRDKLN